MQLFRLLEVTYFQMDFHATETGKQMEKKAETYTDALVLEIFRLVGLGLGRYKNQLVLE
jgi:hypothetical protein